MEDEKEKSVTKTDSDGTISKAILFDGGRYIMEINSKDGASQIAFSIRGVIDHAKIHTVAQNIELFFKDVFTDSKYLGN